MDQKTILLVEDDFLNRRLTKKILLKSGYLVLEAKNTSEALRIMAIENVDLVILDINLGEDKEEGITLGHTLKEQHQLPFIYLTAYANTHILSLASATKPYSYLTKPFKEIDLIASVEIALSHERTTPQSLISSISVKHEDHFIDLPLTAIDYIEAKGNYLLCHSGEKVYRYRSTIKQLLAMPTSITFVRIHRGFLANKDKIGKYSAKEVFINEKTITVSRNYKKNLFKK